MLSGRDEGPIYYREIQKNAYLKRISDETTGSKLRPLGHKKPVLKAMWTLFCVHNGRTPFLEQYPEAESPATLTHKPTWRACLKTARHVTASVKPHIGEEYDFLVDTDHGPVRMLAPDWDSMQDWVTTLRSKLQELKILGGGENVYAAPPVAPLPRAPARDPTSPLPPTPPVPPDRVPGIELNTPIIRPTISETIQQTESTQITQNASLNTQNTQFSSHIQNTQQTSQIQNTSLSQNTQNISQIQDTQNISHTQNTHNNDSVEQQSTESQESVDISNWDCPFSSLPSTSQERNEPKKSVAKICGQNVCVDDSVLKRDTGVNDSDEEFFAEIDRISSDENLGSDVNGNLRNEQTILGGYKQRFVVNNKVDHAETSHNARNMTSQPQGTNITVIQVSNKGPPHTAIPILGPENVFDFSFKQNLAIDSENDEKSFINIVNTEVDIQNTSDNGYGTVFSNDESPYGHLSLTTTVNLTGNNENLTENHVNLTDNNVHLTNNGVNLTSNVKVTQNEAIYERLCMASTSNKENSSSPLPIKRLMFQEKSRKSSLPNLESESAYECLFPNSNSSQVNERNTSNIQILNTSTQENQNFVYNRQNNSELNTRLDEVNTRGNNTDATVSNLNTRVADANVRINDGNARVNDSITRINDSNNRENDPSTRGNNISTRVNEANTRLNEVNARVNEVNTRVNLNQPNSLTFSTNTRVLRSNVERSHSQNAYDSAPRLRENLIRRVQNNSPKRDAKNGKIEANQTKPIWRRGLTELSLLSRLRGIGQGRRQESPTRQENDANDRSVTSPVKVIRRSRPEVRVDNTRRRSNSLSNGDNPGSARQGLQSLRQRQAAALRGEQLRGAAIPATIPVREPPLFAEYNNQLWVAWWGIGGSRCGGRAGDRVAALRGTPVKDSQHARQLIKSAHTHIVDILFHRVPLGKIYVLNKRDHENLGIKLDSECVITSVEPESPAGRAGLTPTGKWALTEVNNRPLNLIKGGEEEMNRLSMHGSEVSVLIQPAPLVKKLRAAIKANKPLLSIR